MRSQCCWIILAWMCGSELPHACSATGQQNPRRCWKQRRGGKGSPRSRLPDAIATLGCPTGSSTGGERRQAPAHPVPSGLVGHVVQRVLRSLAVEGHDLHVEHLAHLLAARAEATTSLTQGAGRAAPLGVHASPGLAPIRCVQGCSPAERSGRRIRTWVTGSERTCEGGELPAPPRYRERNHDVQAMALACCHHPAGAR